MFDAHASQTALYENTPNVIEMDAYRMEKWMLETSMPFWAKRGSQPDGGFFERVNVAGYGICGDKRQVRTQASQTCSFAFGAMMGWNHEEAQMRVHRGLSSLLHKCRREDGLFGITATEDADSASDQPSLDASAFALIAFATAWKAFKVQAALDAGRELSEAIDLHLQHSDGRGGYAETLPAPVTRELAPHMRLVEASLAWFEATNDENALLRAIRIADFIDTCFYARTTHILSSRVPYQPEDPVESWQMLEWTWLLHRLAKAKGTEPDASFTHLYNAAMKRVGNDGQYVISYQVFPDGYQRVQRARGLTAALKAHIAQMMHAPNDVIANRISMTVDMMFNQHLARAPQGAWSDACDLDGRPVYAAITAATGYHFHSAAMALTELVEDPDGTLFSDRPAA